MKARLAPCSATGVQRHVVRVTCCGCPRSVPGVPGDNQMTKGSRSAPHYNRLTNMSFCVLDHKNCGRKKQQSDAVAGRRPGRASATGGGGLAQGLGI